MKKKGAGDKAPEGAEPVEETPAEPQVAATAAPVTVVAAQPEAQPEATQTPATTPGLLDETIQCPACKNGFTVQYESKPVKVKCPSCGTEGVLN
jgi:hypothetical protein